LGDDLASLGQDGAGDLLPPPDDLLLNLRLPLCRDFLLDLLGALRRDFPGGTADELDELTA
jgi:hypothetical protein